MYKIFTSVSYLTCSAFVLDDGFNISLSNVSGLSSVRWQPSRSALITFGNFPSRFPLIAYYIGNLIMGRNYKGNFCHELGVASPSTSITIVCPCHRTATPNVHVANRLNMAGFSTVDCDSGEIFMSE